MKKIFTLLAILIGLIAAAQNSVFDEDYNAHAFEFYQETFLEPLYDTFKEENLKNKIFRIKIGLKFNIIENPDIFNFSNDSFYIIRIWDIKTESKEQDDKKKKKGKKKIKKGKYNPDVKKTIENVIDYNAEYNGILLKIKKSNFDRVARKYYRTVQHSVVPSVGIITLPFKIRPQVKSINKDFNTQLSAPSFTSNFNLGLSAGAKWRISHYRPHFIHTLIHIGVTQIALDSFNTTIIKDNVPITYQKQSSTTSGLSLGGGLVFDFSKFQAGVFLGWDLANYPENVNWIYNRRYWIGLGLGYAIFSNDQSKQTPGTN